MSTPRPGEPGSGKASEETGSKTKQGRKIRRARFRRRISLPRPKLPRPKLRRQKPSGLEVWQPQASRRKIPRPKIPRPKMPKRAGDWWFRFITRLRAIRYWLREKRRQLRRRLERAAEGLAYWWSRRSRRARIQIFAVAGVIALDLIITFLPVPGVPCEVSLAKECAPSNATIAYVPRDADLYVHITVNSDSHQWELAKDLRGRLPNLTALLQSDTRAITAPGGRPIDLSREILPWAKDDLALLGVPGPKKTTAEAYVVGVGDDAKANQFLAGLSPGGKSKQAKVGAASLTVYANGFATARLGDQALFGQVAAVRAALLAKAGQGPRLEGSDQDAAREDLPDVRLAEIYLSRAGVQRFLVGRPQVCRGAAGRGAAGRGRAGRGPARRGRARRGPAGRGPAGPVAAVCSATPATTSSAGATQLGTFVDYGATSGMAVSARVRDDGIELNLVSDLDPQLEQRSPTVFASLPKFEPGLAGEASSDALGYVGVGDLGPALNKALATAGAGAQGLAGSLRSLARNLRKEAGVDPLKDLLPALGGQAALVAEPTGGLPYASLIVDGVDEKKARDALAALQRPLLRSLAGRGGRQVPSFQSKDVDGVTVHSVAVSPNVNLSYAVFDGKLVISTQPDGVAQARDSGGNLAGSNAWDSATNHLPKVVSALVFLNLDEVLGLAQQAGLADDPLYASLSEDISNVQSLGLAVVGSNAELHSELFLAIHN